MAIKFLSNVAVDTDVLFVDTINDRVGIGTTSPGAKFHAEGDGSIIRLQNNNSDANGTFIDFRDSNGTRTGLVGTTGTSDDMFLYTLGAKPIRFNTNATERMRIDSSGNVGIGTNSPSEKLEVYGGNLIVNDGTNKSRLRPTDIYMQHSGTIKAWLRADGNSYFNGGNVGIGTTSPSKKLHISGSDQSTARIRLSNTNSSGGDNIDLVAGINNVGQDGFSIYNATSNQTQLVIQGSGNVGIAVTDFTTTFGSVPDLRVGSTGTGNPGVIDILRKDGTVTAGETTGILQFSVDDDSNYCNAQIEVESASTVGGGNSGGGILKFKTTPSSSGGTPTERMRIDSNGDVGIGTTQPGQKLEVNGNVRANRYYGTGSTIYYVDPNDTTQSAYFAGDIRITDSGTATIKLDSTSSQSAGGSIIVTKNGSESPSMGSITWVQNPGFVGSIWSQRLTSSPYTESAIQLPASSSYDFNIKVLGSNRMTIDSSTGNVGIGTTSPGRQLVVYNSSNAELELYSGATNSGFVYFRDSGDSNIGALQYDHNSNYMAFRVNDSERMRIDSSGKVGIGTTSPQAKLEVGDCESSGNIGDGNIAVKTNSNNTAIVIQEPSGAEQWGLGVNSDGDFVLTDSGTERVRIDDNTGNFGIGTTAPAEKLVVSGSDDVSIRINSTKNGTWTTGQLLGAYEFYGNDASGAGAQIKGKIDCASLNQYGAGFHMRFFTAGGGGGTSAIERMRINSSGAVTIGKTDPSSYNTQGIDLSPSGLASFTRSGNVSLLVNRTGSDGQVVSIRNDNTSVGSISVSGSTTSYNTSSDYRLKENVVDMTGAIERIQQLKPKRFNFISNTEKTVDGFIAHEVQSIIPEAVLGEKDAVDEDGNPEFQGIDQSKIVPLLVGAIKELKAEIENLKLQIN